MMNFTAYLTDTPSTDDHETIRELRTIRDLITSLSMPNFQSLVVDADGNRGQVALVPTSYWAMGGKHFLANDTITVDITPLFDMMDSLGII